jgi:ADP-ribosyl-[dinitrogen reductase] hydrolase
LSYVVKSLEAALWAFYHSNDFRQVCLMAANLCDDANTTAAIYGQIAGAFYGIDGIPLVWREGIAFSTVVHNVGRDLFCNETT